jgi:hypothetical protein
MEKSESITVYIAYRNDSTIPSLHVYAELMEHFHLRAGRYTSHPSRSLALVEFPPLMPDLEKMTHPHQHFQAAGGRD